MFSVLNVESERINSIEWPTGASACHILGLIILIERGMSREFEILEIFLVKWNNFSIR